MSTVIEGTDAIEVQQLLLIASDRLAEYVCLSQPFDTGTVQVCIALRELAESIKPVPMDRHEFTNKEKEGA
jgi:hypothetical protein